MKNKNTIHYTGFLNIYKEAGFTSHDVVAKLRGMLHQRRIGHMGTLDPDATGVLPVALGYATKAISLLEDHTKAYDATLLLGVTTDTYDIGGSILKKKEVVVSEEDVRDAVYSFKGELMQMPPMYSAKKMNGTRLYELARQGIEVERSAVPICINKIEILNIDLPYVRMHVSCSKGTYIRSLCHDIGNKLGCGGCMQDLLRTRAGRFGLDTSIRLSDLQHEIDEKEDWSRHLLSVDQAFFEFPALFCHPDARKRAVNGNPLWPSDLLENYTTNHVEKRQNIRVDTADSKFFPVAKDSYFRIYIDENKFLGIYYWSGRNFIPRKVFIS